MTGKIMNKFKYIVYFIAMFVCTSCNDWLDVEPETSVDEKKLFSTEQGFKDAMAGVYADMASSSLYGQTLSFGFLDIIAQQYDYETVNNSYGNYYRLADYDYEYNSNKNRITAIWNNMYSVIAEINNILLWIEKNGNVMSETTRQQIKGQCYVTRAYLHFDLLRLFAPDVKLSPAEKAIPYVTTFGVESTERSTVSQVIEKVKGDISNAKEELKKGGIMDVIPYEIADKLFEADRYIAVANYYAAEALLARVLLAEGKYSDAQQAAQNVIDSEKFRLVNADASFNVPTESLDLLLNDEQIFALRNKAIFDYSENLHLGKSENGVTSGAALPLTSDINGIYDAINDDVRLANWIQASTNYMTKYNKTIEKFYPKQVLIKLSEMYLIVAESQMRAGDPNALETLNQMRRSRITNANISDKSSITEDELIEEMRREFLGEGQMFFQYKRLNTPIRNILKEVPANNTIFVLPIPEGEIEYGKY
jgi:hypothetical protein